DSLYHFVFLFAGWFAGHRCQRGANGNQVFQRGAADVRVLKVGATTEHVHADDARVFRVRVVGIQNGGPGAARLRIASVIQKFLGLIVYVTIARHFHRGAHGMVDNEKIVIFSEREVGNVVPPPSDSRISLQLENQVVVLVFNVTR